MKKINFDFESDLWFAQKNIVMGVADLTTPNKFFREEFFINCHKNMAKKGFKTFLELTKGNYPLREKLINEIKKEVKERTGKDFDPSLFLKN